MAVATKESPRDRAAELLREALATGVRGGLRDAILEALNVADGRRKSTISEMEYRQLAAGKELVDPDRPGLIMRHGKRNGRVWHFRTEHPETGQQKLVKLGRYPELSVADARSLWADMRAIRAEGRMPSAPGDGSQLSAGVTIRALVERYLSEYARKVKRSWREDARLLDRHIVAPFGGRDIGELDRDLISSVLAELHERAPREAEKLRACLSTLFNVAAGKTNKISMLGGAWLPPDFANPVASLRLPSRKALSHKPSDAELRRLLAGLQGISGEVLRVQMETFARVNEVCGMRWEEIDERQARWNLPAARAKNGRAHAVMLAPATLDRILARRSHGSEWVFPSPRDRTKPVSRDTVISALAAQRQKLGLATNFTSHSLRHAGLTWVAENGAAERSAIDWQTTRRPATASITSMSRRSTTGQPANGRSGGASGSRSLQPRTRSGMKEPSAFPFLPPKAYSP